MKKYSKYLLVVFPALYMLVGFYFRQVNGDLSLRSTDPEYIDFISGMCVATGRFGQANIDHPGAIFQIILAFIFKIIHFFRGSKTPFFEDAMANADMYLAVSNLAITAIIATAMFWAGKAVRKITGSTLYALIIQTAPFIINVWYEIAGRIYPELIFVIPVYLLEVQLLRELYQPDYSPKKSIFNYSLAMGIGLSIKMTFFPLIVLPLFVIKTIKNKLKYLAYTVIVFFVLSPQVAVQWHHFYWWMRGMFVHSGQYQAGESNIIDTTLFVKNLDKLLTGERYFFYASALMVVLLIIMAFTRKRWLLSAQIFSGFTLSVLGLVFIVSKQYAIRYFLPALLFYPFLLILNKEAIQLFFKQKIVKQLLSTVIVIIILFQFSKSVSYMRVVSRTISQQVTATAQTRDFIETLDKNSYTIITSQAYGSPYRQYALMFSFAMGGKQWPNYREKLDKLFPNNYMYFTWDNTIKYWGKPYNAGEIAASGKPVYLYLQKNSKELYNRTVKKLLENSRDISIDRKLLFENPYNHESVSRLYFSVDSIQTATQTGQ